MEPSRDIFDLFRDHQHKLTEQPAKASWKKLERRLDAHQKRNRMALRRNLSVAATLALLIGLTFLISFTIGRSTQSELQTAAQFEEFSVEEDDQAAYRFVSFSRKYQNQPSLYIQEGTNQHKLLVKN